MLKGIFKIYVSTEMWRDQNYLKVSTNLWRDENLYFTRVDRAIWLSQRYVEGNFLKSLSPHFCGDIEKQISNDFKKFEI
jgi:hypothetical protein